LKLRVLSESIYSADLLHPSHAGSVKSFLEFLAQRQKWREMLPAAANMDCMQVTGHGGRFFGGVTSTPETPVVEFCLYMPAFVSFIPSNSDRARDIILWVVMLIFGLCAKSRLWLI
jgi:hypothetical protein